MSDNSINPERLLGRLAELGDVGRDGTGQLVRLAATDSEKLGRDTFISWIRQAGLELTVDRIGNIFGIWKPTSVVDEAPLMLGSHIDTVINAGIYDGCYGVLSGLEVIETLLEVGFEPSRPIVVAAFTKRGPLCARYDGIARLRGRARCRDRAGDGWHGRQRPWQRTGTHRL